MQTEQLHAIVLSCLDYAESDRIVSLFTLEHGRLRAFAKGAIKSQKRFSGSIEPATCVEVILLARDDGLSRLDRADATVCHTSLRSSLESTAMAFYACELVDLLTPEGHPVPRLFRLLASFLDHIDQFEANIEDRRFFEVNLLNILGYRPNLEGMQLQPLQDCLRTGKFGQIKFSTDNIEVCGKMLDRAITAHLPRPLRSLDFLTNVMGPNK